MTCNFHVTVSLSPVLHPYRLRLKERPRPFTQPPPLSWRGSAACTCTTARRRPPQQAPMISSCRKSCGPRAVHWWVFRKPEEPEEHLDIFLMSIWVTITMRVHLFHFALCLIPGILCDGGRQYYFFLCSNHWRVFRFFCLEVNISQKGQKVYRFQAQCRDSTL